MIGSTLAINIYFEILPDDSDMSTALQKLCVEYFPFLLAVRYVSHCNIYNLHVSRIIVIYAKLVNEEED